MAASLQNVESASDYDRLINDAKGEKLLVIHFWADWAPQCGQMNDVIVELATDPDLRHVTFAKLPAEDLPDIANSNQITSVPSFIFVRECLVVSKLEGADVPQFIKLVKQESAKAIPSPRQPLEKVGVATNVANDLNSRLKKLINQSQCMLFMKGTPEDAHCGFSKQVVALLRKHNVQYGSFNILKDEQVREGLKEYSSWPTYPQFYLKGELLGGIDILKELSESGELDEMLPKKQQDIKAKLTELVNRHNVMLFMKGDRQQPKCGFSKTLCGILDETKVSYDTFDILEDELVRQELKTFSNWPTYPQLYVQGNLIGGLDIVKELKELGELESTLKGN